LLADFQPRGAVAEKYGLYLANAGITDRATVIVDSSGIVRHVSSVGPGGKRDIDQLLELARSIDREHPIVSPPSARVPAGVATGATLYVREGCRFCASVLRAMANLHCEKAIKVRDVNKDPGARADLDALGGAGAKVPALVENGKVLFESADIIKHLAEACRA
jgi:glutaredoxin